MIANVANGSRPKWSTRLGSAIIVSRWPTGAKLFLIISAALLPLALIALFATLKTSQIADTENRARLRVASAESTRSVAIELVGDMTALRATVEALARDGGDMPSCARAQGVFAPQASVGARFVLFDRVGRLLCGTRFPGAALMASGEVGARVDAALVPDQGLMLRTASRDGAVRAVAYFPIALLRQLAQPSGFAPPYAAALVLGEERLSVQPLARDSALERRDSSLSALGVAGLTLEMQVRSTPITSPLVIAMLLPLLMWIAAASIAWFVVDRLLIHPLRMLRANVATYKPGGEIDPAATSAMPAQEIRELGDTFRAISRTVALHEAGLAEGLVRQTKLTREVHHRVKNNLQVIASLINFHARSAQGAEAMQAYASIQRRVDALAVVHRNHFAEMEENRGLELRSVIAELASNLRATAPERSGLGIAIDIDPWLVTQDVAVAVAFLITEIVELATGCDPAAQVRIAIKPDTIDGRAALRVVSPALIDCATRDDGLVTRYGRIIEGLARQLRAPLRHDAALGTYEISIAVVGRD